MPVGKIVVVLEEAVDLNFLRIGHSVDGLAAIAGQDFLVNQSADVKILHPRAAEVPPSFVVEEISDAFFVESGFNIC